MREFDPRKRQPADPDRAGGDREKGRDASSDREPAAPGHRLPGIGQEGGQQQDRHRLRQPERRGEDGETDGRQAEPDDTLHRPGEDEGGENDDDVGDIHAGAPECG